MMLDEKDAYLAMFSFLENLYKETESDDLGELLGSMCLLGDGSPADPAIWNDWLAAIEHLQNGKINASLRLNHS